MVVLNRSGYDDETVRRLVEYAFNDTQMPRVGVLVRDLRTAPSRGVAYGRVPPNSPFHKHPRIRYVVYLWIGSPERFPSDNRMNVLAERRRIPMDDLLFDTQGERRTPKQVSAHLDTQLRKGEYVARIFRKAGYVLVGRYGKVPYGGKSSPVVNYDDWQEGLVGLAAHEAGHVLQFMRRDLELSRGIAIKSLSRLAESEAERYSSRVLELFRQDRDSEKSVRREVQIAPPRMGRMIRSVRSYAMR